MFIIGAPIYWGDLVFIVINAIISIIVLVAIIYFGVKLYRAVVKKDGK
ncbi:hypothetical protein [Lentilactobacillus curieae]|nr:hypothetical protein [Lentilactobacillus curieae]